MFSPILRSVLMGTASAALMIGSTAGIGAMAANPVEQQASMPLGHDDVREVQNQLISLGFDPGPADGQAGPGTMSAAQQYDRSRGGKGGVSIDSALLARLKADTATRLTYEQVAERSRARQRATTTAPAASTAAANPLGGILQQIVPLMGAAIANSNNNNNYGPGYYRYDDDPGYYGPPPRYYRPAPGYGFF